MGPRLTWINPWDTTSVKLIIVEMYKIISYLSGSGAAVTITSVYVTTVGHEGLCANNARCMLPSPIYFHIPTLRFSFLVYLLLNQLQNKDEVLNSTAFYLCSLITFYWVNRFWWFFILNESWSWTNLIAIRIRFELSLIMYSYTGFDIYSTKYVFLLLNDEHWSCFLKANTIIVHSIFRSCIQTRCSLRFHSLWYLSDRLTFKATSDIII